MTTLGQQPDRARKLKPGEPRFYSDWRPKPAGAYCDAQDAEAAVAFFPAYCRLTSGKWAGKPFTLEPWEADWIIRPAFGWKRADGTRLYRRVIIWIPRKNGKTELLAGVAHLMLLGDKEVNAELYAIASSEKQAKKVFKAAADMVAYSPDLAETYDVYNESLYCRSTKGRFEVLTGKAHGKHGLRAAYLLGDEVHEWPDNRLYTFVRDSMAAWDQPMEWLISTAGVDNGYGVELWDESLQICEGVFDDPETLVVMWCGPQDPKAKINYLDQQLWRDTNPNYGISKGEDYMLPRAIKAMRGGTAENDFKKYQLNIWVGQTEEQLLPSKFWNACAIGGPDAWRDFEERLTGRSCFGGLDLAQIRDFNALVWVFPPENDDQRWVFLPRLWWPQATFDEESERSRVPFASWAQMGALTLTPGNAADHDAIEEQVKQDCSRFKVGGLGIDVFNAHSVLTHLNEADVPVQAVRFGIVSMSPATKLLEKLCVNEQIDHGGHPVLKWMAANTGKREDNNGNYMPSRTGGKKQDKAKKIDGIAAAVMALAMASREPEPRSALADSGNLLVLPFGRH